MVETPKAPAASPPTKQSDPSACTWRGALKTIQAEAQRAVRMLFPDVAGGGGQVLVDSGKKIADKVFPQQAAKHTSKTPGPP
jgi:hypothetical protein